MTTAVLAATAAAGVLKSIAGFLSGINGPDNVKDVSVLSCLIDVIILSYVDL